MNVYKIAMHVYWWSSSSSSSSSSSGSSTSINIKAFNIINKLNPWNPIVSFFVSV